MAQAQIDLIGLIRKCKYCDKTFKSEAGEQNHMKRVHPLDMDSEARCWTCNKAFTRRQLLYQHYSTVLHQLNCKKHNEGETPEKIEESAHSGRSTLKQAKSYRKQLMERSIRFQPYKKKPLSSLRCTPAIIPLEATCPQADPRTDPKVSFMDLVEEDIEPPQSIGVNKTTEEQKLEQKTDEVSPTERNIDKDLQSVESTKIYPQKAQPAQAVTNPAEIYPEEASTTKTEIYPEIYPEMQPIKEKELEITTKETTKPNKASTVNSIEIYPEIYPENNPGATRGSLQSRREDSTPKLQNCNELTKFEQEIIEMFELPENIKEITSSDNLQVDLDLQTSLNLPLEENSLLDLLIDSDII